MLQRTRVSSVLPVWQSFADRYPEPGHVLALGYEKLDELTAPIGLRWRVPLIWQLASILSERGSVPRKRDELMTLPGVGEYVASALLSLHTNRRAVIVDANIVRWICRLSGDSCDGETRRKKWLINLAESLTPATTFKDYNYGALDLTMTICKTRPDCRVCPLLELCVYGRHKRHGNH